MSKGKKVLCEWLNLDIKAIERKDLELFSYLIRVLLTVIIDEALR